MNTDNRLTITILTDPIPHGVYLLPEILRKLARMVRNSLKPSARNHDRNKYRGHFAVTRSLVEGLNKLDLLFSYNPTLVSELTETVVVLSGVRTLRQAISLKKSGKIKKLFAGPNIVEFSSDANSILASPEVDVVITPCNWVIDLYLEDNPSLQDICFAWPAGVDTEYWKPEKGAERKHILIYYKQNKGPGARAIEPYADYLRQKGYEVSILRYGTYTHKQYLKELQKCQLVVGFTNGSESQCIAWVEAWAADVPTLVARNSISQMQGRTFSCSTAPYLCDQNGLFFDDYDHFKLQFDYWRKHKHKYSPRAWVSENMSDEISAARLYSHVCANL